MDDGMLSQTCNLFIQFRVILHTAQNILGSRMVTDNLFPAIINSRIILLNANTLFLQVHQLPSRSIIVAQSIFCLPLNFCLVSSRVFKTINPVSKLLTTLLAHFSFYGRITLSIGISYPSATSLASTLIQKGRRSDEGNLSKVVVTTLASINHSQRRIGKAPQFQSLSQLLLSDVMNSSKSLLILQRETRFCHRLNLSIQVCVLIKQTIQLILILLERFTSQIFPIIIRNLIFLSHFVLIHILLHQLLLVFSTLFALQVV